MSVLVSNFYYVAAIIFFLTGLYIMLTHPNLIKKVIGMNIIDSSIFLFFVTVGYVDGGKSPIVDPALTDASYVNPLPSGLMLTGIVVSVSITAFALALIMRVHSYYGTLNIEEIVEIRSRSEEE
ncbi:cation:proton antiporter subunit C [Natronospora cellulosivora (SeqCode)]